MVGLALLPQFLHRGFIKSSSTRHYKHGARDKLARASNTTQQSLTRTRGQKGGLTIPTNLIGPDFRKLPEGSAQTAGRGGIGIHLPLARSGASASSRRPSCQRQNAAAAAPGYRS